MILTRDEAWLFLNKLSIAAQPLLGFMAGSWGFSLFVGSISHLSSDTLIINQNRDGTPLIPMTIILNSVAVYHYGDIREIMRHLSDKKLQDNPDLPNQLEYLKSIVDGGMILEFNQQEAIGLVELDLVKLAALQKT